MDSRTDISRDTSRTESDTVRTTPEAVIEAPMIAFPEADLDVGEHPAAGHPFDAAERVLTAAS